MKTEEELLEQFRRGVSGEKEVKMKCPKFVAAAIASNHAQNEAELECDREVCAWCGTWTVDKSEEQTGCCFPVLTTVLSNILYLMPRGGKP